MTAAELINSRGLTISQFLKEINDKLTMLKYIDNIVSEWHSQKGNSDEVLEQIYKMFHPKKNDNGK